MSTSDVPSRKMRQYESEEVVVEYDVARCIHAEECVHGLPDVFDPRRRPWVDPSGASADEVARVVERCPTGALRYRRLDGAPDELPPSTNTVRVAADGPLYVSGDLRVLLPTGVAMRETRVALCRCGESGDKPFCDNSHLASGFQDAGALSEEWSGSLSADGESETVLEISPVPNGPLRLRGPFALQCTGDTVAEGGRGVLCRCGQSGTKPICDGTHKKVGFEAG